MDSTFYYVGSFNILDEEIEGQLVYNKKYGNIFLELKKALSPSMSFGKSYADIPVITGKLNSGEVVTLYKNICYTNHTNFSTNQTLIFKAEYMILSYSAQINKTYNEYKCTLINAFEWSQIKIFNQENDGIKYNGNSKPVEFNWFGMTIKFRGITNEFFWGNYNYEEKTIYQRVELTIKSNDEKPIKEFLKVRDYIISMISFAIRDNVNIDQQRIINFNDTYPLDLNEELSQPFEHLIYDSYSELTLLKNTPWEYNFHLNDISTEAEFNEKLEKLTPIFNLYLSLFKYPHMPKEMVFLNLVQAIETFHSRFYYNDKKKNYIESVNKRFPAVAGDTNTINHHIREILLSPTQLNENVDYIILVSRLNDLLISDCSGPLFQYWLEDDNWGQAIADTRHYYTHYGKAKEKKALKDDNLDEAIFMLTKLLEYNICKQLDVNNQQRIQSEIRNHMAWKQLKKEQNSIYI